MKRKYEREISITAMIKNVLKSWKLLIIILAVGVVIGCVFSAYKAKSTADAANSAAIESQAESITLSDEANMEVQHALAFYESYKAYTDYQYNSIKANINSNNEAELNIVYVVPAENSDEAYALAAYSLSDDDCKAISEANGWDCDYSYIRELVTVTINASSLNGGNTDAGIEDENAYVVVFTAIAPETEQLTAFDDCLNKFAGGSIELVSETAGTVTDNALKSAQYTLLVNMNTVKNNYDTLYKTFTTNQKTVLSDEINRFENGEEIASEAADSTADTAAVTTKSWTSYFSAKRAFLVAVVVLVIGIVVLCFKYVFSGKIHEEFELRNSFGIEVLGTVNSSKNTEAGTTLAASSIKLFAEKQGKKKILITGAADSDEVANIKEALAKEVEGAEAGAGILCMSVADKAKLADVDAVVFVEKSELSLTKNIAADLSICENSNVEILGAVFVK